MHLGDVGGSGRYHVELIGKKLNSRQVMKVVWFGGSNTHGRTKLRFVDLVQDIISKQYPPSSSSSSEGQGEHRLVNKGGGGANSCSYARGFKSSFFNADAKDADLIFLEFSITDGVHEPDDRRRCFESLVRRIRGVGPAATIVVLSLRRMEGHDELIRHYNLPHVYLGAVGERAPAILRAEKIHVNDIGSFLVSQAVGVFLREAERMYNASRLERDNDMAAPGLPGRLYEPTESFDWILGFGGKGGRGWVHDFKTLSASCAPKLEAALSETNSSNAPGLLLHLDHSGNCSDSILVRWNATRDKAEEDGVPCEGCPAKGGTVDYMGGGWVWCHSPWAAVCKPLGMHHHHCPENNTSGIFMQSFTIDNHATDEWPANRPREVSLTMRLLMGYDADFGRAVVVLWVHEADSKQALVSLVDSKWDTHATVVEDVEIAKSLAISPPESHGRVTLLAAVIPLRARGENKTRCWLYIQSIVGEFV